MKKVSKKTQKEFSVKVLLEIHNKDMKRYVGSLSEEFQGRVSGIAEQFSGLNKKLDSHDDQFKKIDGQFRVVHHTLGAMKEDLEIMKEDLSIIKADVKKRVTYEEFESLTRRVNLLEKKAHR